MDESLIHSESERIENIFRQMDLPIRIEDIPDAKEWLYLNGFRDPDPRHNAFDFSAYKTTTPTIRLGIPSTIIRAPFDGTILTAVDDRKRTWGVFGEPGYGGEIQLMGKIDGRIVTAVLAHVIPEVGNENVRKGSVIGRTFESPNLDEGTLGHLHFQLEISGGPSGAFYVDPAPFFLKGQNLKRIYLPHKGPFSTDELRKLGFETRYRNMLNYGIAPAQPK